MNIYAILYLLVVFLLDYIYYHLSASSHLVLAASLLKWAKKPFHLSPLHFGMIAFKHSLIPHIASLKYSLKTHFYSLDFSGFIF